MAQLGGVFDSSQHEDVGGAFDPIPAGPYNMMVIESDYVQTKAGTGHFIKLTIKVIDGKYKGRQIWTNLNVDNPNPVAVEIAQKELATICRAVGKAQIADTMELHGVPFIGIVKIRPAKGDYPASNDMVTYKPAGSIPVPVEAPDPAQAVQAGGVGGNAGSTPITAPAGQTPAGSVPWAK